MATLREIKRRIGSVKSTQKITKAMKMVAASKLKKAQSAVINSRPYANKIGEILKNLVSKLDVNVNPLLQENEVKNVLMIVVSSDRGLCGSFNTNTIKKVLEIINSDYKGFYNSNSLKIFPIGKKVSDYFSKHDYSIYDKKVGIFNSLNYTIATDITKKLVEDYLNKSFDKVIVVYNEFKSVGRSNLKVEQLLPIPTEIENQKDDKTLKSYIEYIYEPDCKTILDKLLPKHLNTQVWRILLESFASEQGSRMMAMEIATENAGDMIRSLNLKYNKARQSAITKELLEIVAGAEALKEKS